MNSFECVLTSQTFLEAIIIGIVTFIIGKIALSMTVTTNKKENENENEIQGLDLTFFLTGFILHFIIELVGLNKWYCDKECFSVFKNLSKL